MRSFHSSYFTLRCYERLLCFFILHTPLLFAIPELNHISIIDSYYALAFSLHSLRHPHRPAGSYLYVLLHVASERAPFTSVAHHTLTTIHSYTTPGFYLHPTLNYHHSLSTLSLYRIKNYTSPFTHLAIHTHTYLIHFDASRLFIPLPYLFARLYVVHYPYF